MTNFTRVFQPIPSWLNWPITFNGPDLEHHRLTNTIHLTLRMTSAQVVETSVTNNSSFQNYSHPDDHNIRTTYILSWIFPREHNSVYPIDGNWSLEIQSINRCQSIKLLNWYRLISANPWPMDNHTKIVHRLLLISSATSYGPGDEIGKTNSDPVFSTQSVYPVILVLPTCPSVFPCHQGKASG